MATVYCRWTIVITAALLSACTTNPHCYDDAKAVYNGGVINVCRTVLP